MVKIDKAAKAAWLGTTPGRANCRSTQESGPKPHMRDICDLPPKADGL